MATTQRNSSPSSSNPSLHNHDFAAARRGREVLALACGVFGVLYLLALISYTPRDLPAWLSFAREAGEGAASRNYMGPVGAIGAGLGFHALGAASYLVPVVLLWLSFATALGFAVWRGKTLVAALAFVMSAACLIEFQPVFFQDWVFRYNLPGSSGGLVGFFLGQKVAVQYLGPVGSGLAALFLYLFGLVGLTGFRPIRISRMLSQEVMQAMHHPLDHDAAAPPMLPGPGAYPGLPDQQAMQAQQPRTVRLIELEEDPSGFSAAPDYPQHPLPPTPAAGRPVVDASILNASPHPPHPLSQEHPEDLPPPVIHMMDADGHSVDRAIPREAYEDTLATEDVPAPPIIPRQAAPGIEELEDYADEEEEELEAAQEEPLASDGLPSPAVPLPEATTLAETVRRAPQIVDTVRPKRRNVPKRPVLASPPPAAAATPSSLSSQRESFKDYDLPPLELLDFDEPEEEADVADTSELVQMQRLIIDTLKTFGLTVEPGDITRGPTITRYEIYPAKGQSVKKIAALEADIARATRAERIHILAPIPGKDTVGIEIANLRKVLVPLRELLEDSHFLQGKGRVPVALGKDVYGKPLIADLAAMPHLLVAGATGSGKSVCINSIIVSLLCRFTPEELRFIMIDPKVVEMQMYSDLPHLAVPVVTSPKKVLLALRWCINEMENRYEMFAQAGCRKLEEFNNRHLRAARRSNRRSAAAQPELFSREEITSPAGVTHNVNINPSMAEGEGEGENLSDDGFPAKLPFVVVIIDELADLMQTAPADVETSIARLCQKARAAGIHLIVATQSPRVDVVTGLIKANIPSRIAFQVASATDSRVILDRAGADKLVGKGDMLYQPPDSPVLVRAQGAFVTDEEVQDIVDHCASQGGPAFDQAIQDSLDDHEEAEAESKVSDADEEILDKCIEVILADRKASTSFLQRRLRLGYTRAARMMDILEERGIVGPGDGAKPREILVAQDADVA